MANVVPVAVYKAAVQALFDLEALHLMVFVFGVSVVLLLSTIRLWKHVAAKGARI